MSRETTVQKILAARASAILRTDDTDNARHAMRAAVQGGFTVIEFTLTIPSAMDLIREFAANKNLCVGAGTVMTPEQAREAAYAGARFLVSPVFDSEIVSLARELDLASIPGTSTPTEMVVARRGGADLVKLFPSPGNLLDFLTALRGPLPDLRVFPTAGGDEDNFEEVLKLGVAGVGFVASLFRPEEMASGNFLAIEARSKRIQQVLANAG